MTQPRGEARLAVLIDADNASADDLEVLLVEIAKYGRATVRRAYGNWTGTHLGGWKSKLLEYSVQPMQQFGYTTGKNSTDSALIIDAMDLLHSGTLDGFCIVSSDSDFTRLAARIREQGLEAFGFGEEGKTPKAFVAACTRFIYVENLRAVPTAKERTPEARLAGGRTLDDLLAEAVETATADDGWAHMGAVGSNLSRLAPDFDPRTWGYAKLSGLMTARSDYEVQSRPTGEGKPPNAYVRRVAKRSAATTARPTS